VRHLLATILFAGGCGVCSDGGEALDRDSESEHAKAAPREGPKIVRAVLPEAVLGTLEGDVRVDHSGRVRLRDEEPAGDAGPTVPARTGDELSIGDTLGVGSAGSAEVRLPDQGRIEIGNEARVTVSPYGMNELSLVRGRAHVSLDAPGQGRRILKVAMPGAYVLVQGTELFVGAADDGSARVIALDGPAVVRTAAGKVDLAAGGAIEIDAEGRAGRPTAAPAAADAQSSMDGWVQGRRELVRRALGATLTKLAARISAEVDAAPATFAKVASRRDANRELLKGLRQKRSAEKAPPGPEAQAAQRQLAEASEALIEETDVARSTFCRALGRFELARLLSPSGPPELDALTEKVGTMKSEAERLFRRSPRRSRPDLRGGPMRAPMAPGAPGGGPEKAPGKAPGSAAGGENH